MALNGITAFALDETPIAIIDFETTGLNPGIDRVVEVSVVRLDPGEQPRIVFDSLVNPMRSMAATDIHGITDQDVANAPQFEEIVGDLLAVLSGCVVAAYNVYFDIKFLNYELGNVGIYHEPPHFCLMYLRTMLGLGETCKLGEACRLHGVELEGSHIASADALASGLLLAKYLETARAQGITTFGDLARLKDYKFVSSFANDPFPAPSGFARRPLNQLRSQVGDVPESAFDSTRHAVAEYWDAISTIVTELEITETKVEELRNERHRLGLTVEQIRWVHAKAFASVITQSAQDRSVDDRNTRRLERVYDCLSKLGWAPGEGITDPSHVEREASPRQANTPRVEPDDWFLTKCDNCQASLKVKRRIADRQAKCPQCGIELRIPASHKAPQPNSEIRPESSRGGETIAKGRSVPDFLARPNVSRREALGRIPERQRQKKRGNSLIAGMSAAGRANENADLSSDKFGILTAAVGEKREVADSNRLIAGMSAAGRAHENADASSEALGIGTAASLAEIPIAPTFLMAIEDVFAIEGRGTIVTGRIEQGTVEIGDEVQLRRAPGRTVRKVVIEGIEIFNKQLTKANAGQNIGLLLHRVNRDEVRRGDLLVGP